MGVPSTIGPFAQTDDEVDVSTQPTLIQSVQRALHVMEALAGRHGRATVKQLARDTGLTLPTTYHQIGRAHV